MKKTYLIQAHKNPEQLLRLINRLDDGESFFYVHIDTKSNFENFTAIIKQPNVKLIENRVDCIWGDFSQVETTLNLIKETIQAKREAYTIFISGQDYPIKNNAHINSYLEKNKEYEHIDFKLNNVDSINEPIPKNGNEFYIYRIRNKKVNFSNKKQDFILFPPWNTLFTLKGYKIPLRFLQLLLKGKINLISELFKSKAPSPFNFHYLGSQWWAFRYETLLKIYNYVVSNEKALYGFYKETLCADELFFQTILKHLMKTDKSIKIKENLTVVDFSRGDGCSPVDFTKNDLPMLVSQPENKLFARKFNFDVDSEIFDLIDKYLLNISNKLELCEN